MQRTKLKVGLHVLTRKYQDQQGRDYWYEGTIMRIGVTSVIIRPVQEGARSRAVPIEDVVYIRDWTRGKWISVEDYSPPYTGRKLKPSGKQLPQDYGE